MTLTKKAQIGLMFSFYLARAGRANVHTAAENLNVSVSFLEQVSRQLRMAGVLTVKRGPGGGYELNGEPTVLQVLEALGVHILGKGESQKLSTGPIEARTLAHLVGSIAWSVTAATSISVRDCINGVNNREIQQLNSLSTKVVS